MRIPSGKLVDKVTPALHSDIHAGEDGNECSARVCARAC